MFFKKKVLSPDIFIAPFITDCDSITLRKEVNNWQPVAENTYVVFLETAA
jgi:hypothetical protein